MGFKEEYGVFTTQTRVKHAIMVVFGVVVAHMIYIFTISKLGGTELITEESITAVYKRRDALIVTSIGCSLYFVAASMRAIGGLLLNIFYIWAIVLISPYITALMYGHIPTYVCVHNVYRWGYILEVFPLAIFPSIIAPLFILIIWPLSFKLRKATFKEWVEENLPY